LFAAVVSKFVPLTVSDVPAWAMLGLKPETVGAPPPDATVTLTSLVSEPADVVTAIVPVVAPPGTVTVSWVLVAAETVAPVPLKVTVFWLGVVENPVPEIVTTVDTGPVAGENEIIDTFDDA
jgi:hypothetical protein